MHHSAHPSSVMVRIQGARVRFSSDFEPLNSFARTHFAEQEHETEAGLVAHPSNALGEKAEIDAHVEWIEESPPRTAEVTLDPGTRRLDRDIYLSERDLSWTHIDDFNDLNLRFALEENQLCLQGQHFFSLSRNSRRNRFKKILHRRRLSTLREKRYSTILYYTMYYPAFWWLERQGLFPLHAAAVDLAGSGVVLCGLPGGGKSTLSVALLALPESRLLSDNIVFFDHERVFRCPEPVLMDDLSLKLIGEAGSLLHGLGRRHVYGRAWSHLPADRIANQTVPRLWLFVGLGDQSRLRPLSFKEVWQRFTAVNWIAKELRRYLVYRSVLGHLSPDSMLQGHGDETIVRQLYDQGHCYELTVGLDDGLPKAIDLVYTLVEAIRS